MSVHKQLMNPQRYRRFIKEIKRNIQTKIDLVVILKVGIASRNSDGHYGENTYLILVPFKKYRVKKFRKLCVLRTG